MPQPTLGPRFWAKVDKDGPLPDHNPQLGKCWLWTGYKNPRGYGRANVGGTMTLVHRAAFLALVGPIPTGLTLDHLCRQPACCRPEHLEAVTNEVNIRRGTKATATHCAKGHPYDGSNLGIAQHGTRLCRTCSSANTRRWRERSQAGAASVSDRAAPDRCKHDHEYTAENTYFDKYGARSCRTCGRLRARRARRPGRP